MFVFELNACLLTNIYTYAPMLQFMLLGFTALTYTSYKLICKHAALCEIGQTFRLSSCWLSAQSTDIIHFCCCMFCNLRHYMRSTSHFGMRHIINRSHASLFLQETCQSCCSDSTERDEKNTQNSAKSYS